MSDEQTAPASEPKPKKIKPVKAPKAAKQPRVPRAPRADAPLIVGTFSPEGSFVRSEHQPPTVCTMLHEVKAWVSSAECGLPDGVYNVIRIPTNTAGEPVTITIGESKVRAVKVG